ncbi:MAG: 50S ribosomal protein L18 [Phycisphaerae bacterium]|nr:50S ribosomal protein L18 [Phycisphaerae bacterium]
MKRIEHKKIRRLRRRRGTRKRILGAPDRPRLTVFRSARHMYAQIVDDLRGVTLCSASTMEKDDKANNGGNSGAAADVGKRLAERASSAGISAVVFDRNGYLYHGRVKALAEAAREGGLRF